MTNWSRWSLSRFGIRRDVVSVLSSNHFSPQQLANYPTNRLLFSLNMPMTNSRTFQSASGLNTITRPTPKRSGGDYLSGQQVCHNKFGLLLIKTNLLQLRSMMVFTDLPLTQEFKTLGMDDYLWVQALFNHEELERLRGQEPTDPHQRFLWRIIRMGVIDPEAGEKVMDASTRSMRHSSAIGMRLWKMWREAESRVSFLWSLLD